MSDSDQTPIHLFPLFFEHASRLKSVWSTGGFLPRALSRISERPYLHRVLLGAITKQLRHLASVRELALRREASDAKSILPSMLENVLAVGFVTKPKWEHVAGKKKIPLSQDLRALLVLAQPIWEQRRRLDGSKNKSQDPVVLLGRFLDLPPGLDVSDALGKEGTKILDSEPYTFSGLTLSELADKFGSESAQWYNAFFGTLYDFTPGPNLFDSLATFESDIEPRWTSSHQEVRLVLLSALKLTHALFAHIDKHCDLGYGPSELVKNLAKEFESLQ